LQKFQFLQILEKLRVNGVDFVVSQIYVEQIGIVLEHLECQRLDLIGIESDPLQIDQILECVGFDCLNFVVSKPQELKFCKIFREEAILNSRESKTPSNANPIQMRKFVKNFHRNKINVRRIFKPNCGHS
jgi:hypothetical protein